MYMPLANPLGCGVVSADTPPDPGMYMWTPIDVIYEHGHPLRSRALYKTYPLESRDQRKGTPSDLVISREIGFTPIDLGRVRTKSL